MKKPIVVANWKMNKTTTEGIKFISKLNHNLKKVDVDVVITPAFVMLSDLVKHQGHIIKIGAQNMHYLNEGAYTGEVSPVMLTDIDVKYVILGHSERRQIFHETDDIIALKVKSALKHELIPILCVGETLNERTLNKFERVITKQIKTVFKELSKNDAKKVIIAYEPIWSIGTGVSINPVEANDAILIIREIIKNLFDEKIANEIKVLYGGSLNEKNVLEFAKQKEIDGGLIGGASLKEESFLKIINVFNEKNNTLKNKKNNRKKN